MPIVTTKVVKNEQIVRRPQALKNVTTKDVEAKYIDKPVGHQEDGTPIFEPTQGNPLTTHNFEDIAEKNRRDQIASEQAVIEAWRAKEAEEKAKERQAEDILIGTLNSELIGLYDPDWKKEPVWITKKKRK